MKKLWSFLCACAMVIGMLPMVAISASAAEPGDYVTSGDYKYYVRYDETISIDEYYGSATTLSIPSKIDGYVVTQIGYGAFQDYTKLKSVTIPNTVTSISWDAFDGCTSLTTVSIPASVESIDSFAFDNCPALTTISVNSSNPEYCVVNGVLFTKDKKMLVQYPAGKTATTYTIPSGVTTIDSNAFSDCLALTGVTIPNTVTTIGGNAFEGCTALKSLTIPTTVKAIGGVAFANCDSLKSLKFPSGITDIPEQVCYDCDLLTSVTIPSTVTKIEYSAFAYCELLTGVTIPSKVTVIEFSAFRNCLSLTSIKIPNSVTNIESSAFYNCDGLKSVTIGSGVVTIENSTFYDCDSLTSVKLPNSVKSLGSYAFGDCDSLKSVTLSNKLTAIENGVFDNCDVLTKVTIPSGVESIGSYAFAWCEALTAVVIPKSMKSIADAAFYSDDLLQNVYYEGTQTQWNGITIGENNNPLTAATFHYNYVTANITNESDTASYANNNAYASVTVTAVGNGLTYTWYVKDPGDTQYSKSSIATATYKAKMTSTTSGRLAYCIVKDQYGNQVQSKTFVLRRKAAISSEPATVAYAKKGAKASVKIGAVGDGLTYTWYIKNANGTKYSKSSITSSTYTTAINNTSKGRLVYCVVKDKYGKTARSKTFLLRESVSITSEPATAAYAKMGAKVSVKIGASGDGLTYTWYTKNDGVTKYSKSSVKSATYSATMSNAVKGRRVYCVVKDKYGKTVQTKTFILRESVSITTQPKTAYAKNGAKVSTTVKARGDGLTYTWYVKNAGQTKYSKSSTTKATYSTTMNSASKNRLLYCVVKDQYGKSVKSTTVQLKMN